MSTRTRLAALAVATVVSTPLHAASGTPVSFGGPVNDPGWQRLTDVAEGRRPSGTPPRSDVVLWRGDTCETKELYVRLYAKSAAEAKSSLVKTLSDATCTQVPTPTVTQVVPDNGVQAAVDSHYVATSHTLQDIVFIDVAWFRSSSLVYWDGSKAWHDPALGKVITWLDGGPGWWPTKTPPKYYYANFSCPGSGFCSEAATIAEGNFHTDFLHCNVTNQDIRMVTDVYAQADGSRIVEFYKYGTCAGLHSATDHRTQRTSGGYGGQTAGALYTCAQGPESNPPKNVPCANVTQ